MVESNKKLELMIKPDRLFQLMVGSTCNELIVIIVLTIGFLRLYLKEREKYTSKALVLSNTCGLKRRLIWI
jgi:hypothetical protein